MRLTYELIATTLIATNAINALKNDPLSDVNKSSLTTNVHLIFSGPSKAAVSKREESSSPEEVSRKGREPRVIANLDIASDTTSSSGGSRNVSPVPAPEEEMKEVTKKEAGPDSKMAAAAKESSSSKPDADDDAANCILSVLEQDETSTQEIIDEIDTLMTEGGMDGDLGEGEEDPATDDDDDGEDLDLAPEDEDDPLTSEDEEEDLAAEEEEPMDIMDSIDQELAK